MIIYIYYDWFIDASNAFAYNSPCFIENLFILTKWSFVCRLLLIQNLSKNN
jgi:hypothetical protein